MENGKFIKKNKTPNKTIILFQNSLKKEKRVGIRKTQRGKKEKQVIIKKTREKKEEIVKTDVR